MRALLVGSVSMLELVAFEMSAMLAIKWSALVPMKATQVKR